MKKLLLIAVLVGGNALALSQDQAAIALAQSRPMKITSIGEYPDCELVDVGGLYQTECSLAYQSNLTDPQAEL